MCKWVGESDIQQLPFLNNTKFSHLFNSFLNYFALLFRNATHQILIKMQLQYLARELNEKKSKERFFFFLHTIPALKWSYSNFHVCSTRSSTLMRTDWKAHTGRSNSSLGSVRHCKPFRGGSLLQIEPGLCPYVVVPRGDSISLRWRHGEHEIKHFQTIHIGLQ